MYDILYDAALEYNKLLNIRYKILLGRKNHLYILMVHFPKESFFHLAGLQHLKDITFPSTNKERIYKEILNKKITIKDIQKSVFYNTAFIEDRLLIFQYLQGMFNSNTSTYLINTNQYVRYTTIKADYLCEQKISSSILYLFLILETKHPQFENECKACSFFIKRKLD